MKTKFVILLVLFYGLSFGQVVRNAGKVGTKRVDETNIGSGKVLSYDGTKLIYSNTGTGDVLSDNWQEPEGGYLLDGSNDYLALQDYANVRGFRMIVNLSDTSDRALAVLGTNLTVNITSGAIALGSGFTNTSVYINGISTSTAQTGYNDIVVLADEFSVSGGKIGTDGSSYGDFTLYDFKLFNKDLTSAEITALYNNGIPSNVPYELQGASNNEMISSSDDQTFETWTGHWTTRLSSEEVVQSTAESHNGSASMRVDSKGVSSGAGWHLSSTYMDVSRAKAGKRIKISFWVKGDASSSTSARLYYTGNKYFTVNNWAQNYTDWTKVEIEGVMVDDLDRIELAIGNQPSGEYLYFDDFSVKVIGNVLDLEPKNAGSNGWVDISGNNLNALTYNDPIALGGMKDYYRPISTTEVNLSDSQPSESIIKYVIVENEGTDSTHFSLGTSSGTYNIISSVNILAGETKVIIPDSPNSSYTATKRDLFTKTDGQTVNIKIIYGGL